jgi:hypothetical protein
MDNRTTNAPSQPRFGPTRKFFWIFTIVVFVLAGYGFFERFLHFFKTLQANDDGRFTIVPMLNYLAVASGFLCMLGWAILGGMFRDIEKPKYTMLENESKLDRGEAIERSA